MVVIRLVLPVIQTGDLVVNLDTKTVETVWGRGYVLREPHEADERIPA